MTQFPPPGGPNRPRPPPSIGHGGYAQRRTTRTLQCIPSPKESFKWCSCTVSSPRCRMLYDVIRWHRSMPYKLF